MRLPPIREVVLTVLEGLPVAMAQPGLWVSEIERQKEPLKRSAVNLAPSWWQAAVLRHGAPESPDGARQCLCTAWRKAATVGVLPVDGDGCLASIGVLELGACSVLNAREHSLEWGRWKIMSNEREWKGTFCGGLSDLAS
jgi:hypothetical protein